VAHVAKENKLNMWNIPTEEIKKDNSIIISNIWDINLNDEIKKETNNYFSCWQKKYCKEMTNCDEAKFYLNSCWLSRLDSDKDWTPCESLCN